MRNSYFKEHLRTAASGLTLQSDCLKLCFWTVAFKTILTQYYYKNTSGFQLRALNTIRRYVFMFNPTFSTRPAFTIETLEQGLKYVQS